jgi:hypothetical protein
MTFTFMKLLQLIKYLIKLILKIQVISVSGWRRHELPIKDITVQPKTQEDFTSGIETRPGVTPPLWPPNQQMNQTIY